MGNEKGVRVERYRCHCRDCPVRAPCMDDPKGRQIEVWPHAAQVQAMRARPQEAGPRSPFTHAANPCIASADTWK
ncbi:MAG: transposase [Verrucomicrobia bacterium]|nr:transposase [Verrucomicrobiota bacterium]